MEGKPYGAATDATTSKSVHVAPSNRAGGEFHLSSSPSPARHVSSMDYHSYIRHQYPAMALQPLAILLREQNAWALFRLSTARQNTQTDMYKFTDKLFDLLAKNVLAVLHVGSRIVL